MESVIKQAMARSEITTERSDKDDDNKVIATIPYVKGTSERIVRILRPLAWAPNPLSNHKVSWLKSERKGLGKTEKSRWCSVGAVVLEA